MKNYLSGDSFDSTKQLLRKMKATFLFLILFTSSLLATNADSQVAKVNISSLNNATVIQVLRTIESQTDYLFVYDKNEIDLTRPVQIEAGTRPVEDILSDMFSNTNVVYAMKGNNIMLMEKSANQAQQQSQQKKVISGLVTDPSGSPLPGVTVAVKGTTLGTITNAEGNYFLTDVPANGTLVFSFVGMKTQEIPVAGKTSINAVMTEETIGLEEVVAIGYGVQRKEAVTGSVVSVQSETLRAVPSSNISQALQGRMPGVEMSQTSTKPGATMQIRIRGTRSLNADNNPLIVLDGIPFAGSIGDINPNDIKSVDVLKDASATAIYGSRGANGVILVTTFKGKLEQKAQVSYDGYYGVKSVFAKYPMMSGPEFVALRQAAGKYSNGLDESNDVNTDWQDLMYRKGFVNTHNISVSGGTKTGNYNFGIGYYKDQAVLPEQNYERFSIRGTLDQNIGQYVKVGFTTNNNFSINNGNNLGIYNVLSATPISNPYNEDGSWKRVIHMAQDDQWVYSREIIENLGDKWIDQTKAFGSYNTIYGEVKIPWIEGLKYRANVGANFRTSNGGSYTGEGVFAVNEKTVSTASISNSLTTNWAIENLLTYDRTFAEKHQVNVVALYSAEETRYNSSYISAKDIPSDAFQFYNLGRAAGEITINPDYQGYQVSGLMSYMGRVMYSYDNRYMLSATLRSDASSRLAKGHQWHTYPAISAGWNIKNESFMSNVTPIEMLKLRMGYGQTSNQAVSPYSTLGLLSTRPYNFGSDYSIGYYVSQLPNENLGWEYSVTYNYGVDFSLLKNRLSGTVEYYVTNTKDILLSVGLPPTSGVSSYMANIGETQNKGWELNLSGVILDNVNGWTWEAGINLYANRNKIKALASGTTEDKTNWWFVGHPIDVIYDYKKIGLWQQDDPYRSILEPGTDEEIIGSIKVEYTGDYNEDGTPTRRINADDRQIMSLEPDFQGGFNTRVSYKGFDLSATGTFKSGGILISTLYSSSGYLNLLTSRRNNVKVDYWTPENTDAKYPSPKGKISGDNPNYGSTLGYFDASYMKIQTITLGYNFDKNKWVKNAGIDKLRLYCTVQNPFVFFSPYKKESGMDPETNSYGNENAAVAYSYNLRRLLTIGTNTPTTRNYMIGINLTF
jgi:TonB-linked SusC/RagA family outer membrane protein